MVAAQNGHLAVVKTLIEAQADVRNVSGGMVRTQPIAFVCCPVFYSAILFMQIRISFTGDPFSRVLYLLLTVLL